MANQAKFTQSAGKRIIAATKFVEQIATDNQSINHPPTQTYNVQLWAKLTDNDTLDDGRHKYAWTAQSPDQDGFKDSPVTTVAGTLDKRYAIDISEIGAESIGDALPNGKIVLLTLNFYTDDSGNPQPQYTFQTGGGSVPIVVKITSTADGKGKYFATSVKPYSGSTPATSTTDLGTDPGDAGDTGDAVLFFSEPEYGLGIDHQLTSGTYAIGVPGEMSGDDTPLRIVRGYGFKLGNCSDPDTETGDV